jgi:putative transcriptional regulator
VLALRPRAGIEGIETIAATLVLARRGLSLLRGKRAIEAVLETGRHVVEVPMLDDIAVLAEELAEHGIAARAVARAPVDARAVRRSLGLTQEQFALRFGLDVDALRNWEHGRRSPDRAAESYLRAIARFPSEISLAQEEEAG